MLNFIKSLIPNAFIVVALGVNALAKAIGYISTIIVAIGLQMHMYLDTERGRKIRQIEAKVKEMMDQIVKAQKAAQVNLTENSRLAQSMKSTQTQVEQPSNVILLGKKKDEPTDPKG